MAIHPPGEKFRWHNILSKKKHGRGVVAVLSLTAMVDMFTVLVIFLLQNYNSTGEVIFIPKEISLPQAQQIKELKPSVVVTITKKEILIDKDAIIPYEELQLNKEWMIQPLFVKLQEALAKAKSDAERNLQKKLKAVVSGGKPVSESEMQDWSKVTIQADKGMDFLTVKKVMYTVTEAGAGEINFAVTKEKEQQ